MYSPKIREDLIPILYQLRVRLGVPMTDIVDEILRPELLEMAKIHLKEETVFYDYDKSEEAK